MAGGLLVAGGLAGVVLFVWQVVAPGSDPTDDAVAGGQVAGLSAPPTPAAMFTVEAAGTYTVWIDTGGTINSSTRDAIVAAANCAATFSDGVTKSFRGAVQGSSVVAVRRAVRRAACADPRCDGPRPGLGWLAPATSTELIAAASPSAGR